jgi:hypothetical protein
MECDFELDSFAFVLFVIVGCSTSDKDFLTNEAKDNFGILDARSNSFVCF